MKNILKRRKKSAPSNGLIVGDTGEQHQILVFEEKHWPQIVGSLVILFLAVMMIMPLLFTGASSRRYLSVDVESGTVSGVTLKNDSSAAGGVSVYFDAPPPITPPPTPPPPSVNCQSSAVWSNLETCGWPGASNTGPSGALTDYSNGLTINSSGTYTNLNIQRYLNINASNVTVRNFRLTNIQSGYTAVRVDQSATNVVIEDCEINPNFVTQFAIWGFDGITVRRCEIYNNGNAIQARQNLVFDDNYCHDIDDVANDGDDWHTNCVIAVNDSRGVSGWRIRNNTMRLGTPGGLKYYSGVINTLLAADNRIENNLIANGAFSMYLFDTRSANVTPSSTYVTNNRFSTIDNPKVGLYGIWYTGQGWAQYKNYVSFTGNTILETGQAVNGTEP